MSYKHGHTKLYWQSLTYRSYYAMLQRCCNSKCPHYEYWGGRGIYVEDYFRGPDGFQHFLDYMGKRPDGKSFDRYPDNNGPYARNNMRWATPKEQRANARPISCGPCKQRMFIAMNGQGTMVASNNQNEFARRYGLNNRHILAACASHGDTKLIKVGGLNGYKI